MQSFNYCHEHEKKWLLAGVTTIMDKPTLVISNTRVIQ